VPVSTLLRFRHSRHFYKSFDRNEATEDKTNNYKAIQFVTDVSSYSLSQRIYQPNTRAIRRQALRHSKVKLTWDDDDPERSHITRRALSRQEVEEADFKAYLASSTSESEADEVQKPMTEKTRRLAKREKLRTLLLDGGNDNLPEGWGRHNGDDEDDVDMEITFTPGLNEAKDGHETTLEKYQRKLKEKQKKRKDQAKDKVAEKIKKPGDEDDFFDDGSGEEVEMESGVGRSHKDDNNRTNSEGRIGPSSRPIATPEELALIVASDNPNKEPKHFDLKSVLKSEKKLKGKRKKSKKEAEEDHEIQEDFVIDVKDERFTVLHEDHTFAIDPSSPQCVDCVHPFEYSYSKTTFTTALERQRAWRPYLKNVPNGKRRCMTAGPTQFRRIYQRKISRRI